MTESESLTEKQMKKMQMIQRIVDAMDTIGFQIMKNPADRFRKSLPNNANFINFRQYQASQDIFIEEWERDFDRDLKRYIAYLAERHPFL